MKKADISGFFSETELHLKRKLGILIEAIHWY